MCKDDKMLIDNKEEENYGPDNIKGFNDPIKLKRFVFININFNWLCMVYFILILKPKRSYEHAESVLRAQSGTKVPGISGVFQGVYRLVQQSNFPPVSQRQLLS
jgi:hypothetical protein